MAIELPPLRRSEFERRLVASSPAGLDERPIQLLWLHYEELCRWGRRQSLVGPGDAERLVERHYGESLWALGLLPDGPFVSVDVGSGGGFPGWVLAAARPDARHYLVESRQRKWAFLEAASRRASLSCRCLNARVGPAVPSELDRVAVDRVTARAVRLDERTVRPLVERLSIGGSFLLWVGAESEVPELLEEVRRVALPGGDRRWIVEARPRTETGWRPRRDHG